ncbi:MAG: MauE/DoxX family redox-associated membrane protein [Anaerolineales bacterium]|jgi:uncharacterized membrane protein YphA (DoxX/SURF4 family)
MSILILLLRIFTAYIFVVSGWAKMKSPGDFCKVVNSYQILPESAIKPFIFVLPRAEIALGTLIGLGFFTRIAAFFTMCFLSVFATAIIINILRGKSIHCGCFGKSHKSRIGWNLAVRDLVLILVMILIYFSNGGEIALDYFLTKIV